jgi:hypothetical protein
MSEVPLYWCFEVFSIQLRFGVMTVASHDLLLSHPITVYYSIICDRACSPSSVYSLSTIAIALASPCAVCTGRVDCVGNNIIC